MKLVGYSLGISGLLLLLGACGDDPPATGGNGGSSGATTGGGGASGGKAGAAAGGGMAGTPTTGGTMAGGGAGGAPGGAGGGGAGGASGGGGAGGGAACDGKTGKAMKFASKVNDMIAGDVGAAMPSGDMPRTLELWAKFTSAESWTAEQSIIELGRPIPPAPTNNKVWGIDMSGRDGTGGRFGPYCNGVSDNNGGSGPLLANTAVDVGWLHLAWGYAGAGGAMLFTVNGEPLPHQDPGTGFTLNLTPGIILLGASQNFGNAGWDGVMDELRIWSTFRTAAEIKASMKVKMKGTEPGLALYYPFDEATGTDVADITATAARTLKNCTAQGGACPAANTAMAMRVESDIPGPFTCAP